MDWGSIAKIAGLAAAPFTGGASLALSGLGSALGGAAKGQATERAGQNINAQNNYQTQQQALLNTLLAQGRDRASDYGTRQGATSNAYQGRQQALGQQSNEALQLAQLGLTAPSVRAQQSVLGSLMQNLQPVSITGGSPAQQGRKPTITGGLNPSALDPMTRQHGGALMKQALEAQLTGSDIPKATDFKADDWLNSVVAAPEGIDYSKGVMTPPKYKEAGKGESILSLLGTIADVGGSLLGAFGGGDSGGGGGGSMNNRMPSAYTGYDRGALTPSSFQIPRGQMRNIPDELAAVLSQYGAG